MEKFPDATPLKEELRFYSFVTNETGSIPITKTHQGKAYYRPGHSYLLVVDGGAISLFNPLTDKVISLPVLPPDSRNIMPIFSGEDPTRNQLLHIVFRRPGPWQLNCATFHPESMGWKYIDKKYNIPKPKDEPLGLLGMWIVESGGAFLRVPLSFKDNKGVSDPEASIFHVYALNFEGESGQPCWVRVHSIGNQMLFLDYKTGFSAREQTAGLKGNCIYFIVEDDTVLGTSMVEGLPCPFKRCTWFVPSLH